MILIVDDDPTVTASLALLFERRGYEVATAATPDEALAALGRGACRVVVQDMNFSRGAAARDNSGEEGLDLLRRIKAGHTELPVILITAWGSSS